MKFNSNQINRNHELRVMSVMAHQDDFEFNSGGAFALLRKHHSDKVKIKILTTNQGASGHHEMPPEETCRVRELEARASAAMIGAEYECLKCLDGKPLPGQVFIDHNFLGGLWNAIRNFEPDYIFCPSVVSDPLAGIHIDHYNTAWGVRYVAYHLSVPYAYPTMTGPVKKKLINPVIINVDDVYACERGFDAWCDVSKVFELKQQMTMCHSSQIFEWLPWVKGNEPPTEAKVKEDFAIRHWNTNERYDFNDEVPREYFRFTQWGKDPDLDQIALDFPFFQFGKELSNGNLGDYR